VTPEIVPQFFRVGESGRSQRFFARLDWSLVGAVAALTGVGLLFIFSAKGQGGQASAFLARQGLATAVGVLAMGVLTLFPYSVFQTYAKGIYLASVAALAATLVVGTRLRGSRSWIDLGTFYFQPVEVTRLASGGGLGGLRGGPGTGFAVLDRLV
jgi:cell division protein FtsW (lipid II flippase)